MVTLMLLLILIPLLEKAVSFAKAYDINSRVE
jgi:hypothetical protein